MFAKVSLEDWENTVKKQLKSDDIYSVLTKENLEGITVRPYYDRTEIELKNLPKCEESTHLVSPYSENLENEVFAFLLNENVEDLTEKTVFINNKDLAEHLTPDETNRYFSLIDIFSEDNSGEINLNLGKELLAKSFDRSLCVDVSLHQNAGASIVQQLAFALAKTIELTENFGADVLSDIVYKLATGGNYFFEISKLRALKILVNQLSKEFGKNEIPFIYAETSLRNKAINDEENNLIRSTLELSSAMIGGADAVFSYSYKMKNENVLTDEISFKQQIVLAYESIINVFEDAGNGSYYIENLTQELAEKAWKLFLEIENSGGYCQMLKDGKIQEMIFNQAMVEQKWVEEGKTKLIGINLFPKLEQKKTAEEMYSSKEIKRVRLAEMFE